MILKTCNYHLTAIINSGVPKGGGGGGLLDLNPPPPRKKDHHSLFRAKYGRIHWWPPPPPPTDSWVHHRLSRLVYHFMYFIIIHFYSIEILVFRLPLNSAHDIAGWSIFLYSKRSKFVPAKQMYWSLALPSPNIYVQRISSMSNFEEWLVRNLEYPGNIWDRYSQKFIIQNKTQITNDFRWSAIFRNIY